MEIRRTHVLSKKVIGVSTTSIKSQQNSEQFVTYCYVFDVEFCGNLCRVTCLDIVHVEQLRTAPVGFGVGGTPAWGRQATTLQMKSGFS